MNDMKIPACLLACIFYGFCLGVGVQGCGGSDPTPPTGSECSRVADISQNCYTCASTPACHWCASSESEVRGCYDRSEPLDCGGTVVRISDLCNELDEGLDGLGAE